jgi:hypothetical protein
MLSSLDQEHQEEHSGKSIIINSSASSAPNSRIPHIWSGGSVLRLLPLLPRDFQTHWNVYTLLRMIPSEAS